GSDLAARGPPQWDPAGQVHQRGAGRQRDEAIGDADLPTTAGGGLERVMNAQPPVMGRVEEAVHSQYLICHLGACLSGPPAESTTTAGRSGSAGCPGSESRNAGEGRWRGQSRP